ncbi:MAG: MATE family efflux transporter, partial [Geminicoccaceae bacterium]
SALLFSFNGLRMGTTGLAAQAYGRVDGGELTALLVRALALACLLGVLLNLLRWPILAGVSLAFSPGEAVAAPLHSYVGIRLIGAPAAMMQMVLFGWLLGVQDARGPLYVVLISNLSNIALDLLFVVGVGMGAAGVALATVLAEVTGLVFGLHRARRHMPPGWHQTCAAADLLAMPALLRLVQVNGDIFLRSLCLQIGFVLFTAVGSRLGTLVVAANAVLLNFQTIAAYGLDGFAYATESRIGAAIGRRRAHAVHAAIGAGVQAAAWLALGLAGVFLLAGDLMIRTMTDIDAVRNEAWRYWPYLVLSPIVSVWSFMLDGMFTGATATRAMRNSMVVSLLVFALALAALVPPLDAHGLWLAFLIFMAARAAFLGFAYVRIEGRGGFIALGDETAR